MPIEGNLEETTARIYRDIFAATEGRHLARVWNYVPEINTADASGLEYYRAFCRGRSHAFERHFGADFATVLPAASAVGAAPGKLAVVFASCVGEPRHVENPLQVPAYEYPEDYGPRPPSFSRASVSSDAAGQRIFVSGTAAIRGCETVAPDQTREQLDCTLANLAGISQACGIGPDLGRDRARQRYFKVYIRHANESGEIAQFLANHLFRPDDLVTYLQADICRSSLKVEIEASIDLPR